MKAPKCKYPQYNTEVDLGKYEDPDIGLDDHNCMLLFGGFDYESGNQGLGYIVDTNFLEKILNVFGVNALLEINGKYAWVEHNMGKIFRIVSVDGKREFDIEKMCLDNADKNLEKIEKEKKDEKNKRKRTK